MEVVMVIVGLISNIEMLRVVVVVVLLMAMLFVV